MLRLVAEIGDEGIYVADRAADMLLHLKELCERMSRGEEIATIRVTVEKDTVVYNA